VKIELSLHRKQLTGGYDVENSVLQDLEWEVLREPITVTKVDDRSELPKGEKKITVSRERR
jgi:hypothetical protein